MKRSMTLIHVLSAMLCMAAAGTAAATTDDTLASTPAGGTPPPQMSALYPRIGKWHVTIRTEPGKSSPKGGLDRGVMTMTKGPGGFSIVQDFWSRGTSGYIVGQSYAWWDTQAKAYKSVWCDNQQGCTEFTTAISGDSWTTELDGEANGEKVHTVIHAVMSKDHNTIHEEVSNAYNGGPARVETVSDYKRVAAGAKAG